MRRRSRSSAATGNAWSSPVPASSSCACSTSTPRRANASTPSGASGGRSPQTKLVERPQRRCPTQELLDGFRALAWAAGARVDLEVVEPVLVDDLELLRGHAGRPVTPGLFTPLQLLQRAMNAHEHDVQALQRLQAVLEPPGLAEQVV